MKRIKALLVAGVLAFVGITNSMAQVRDISVTLSPSVSYTWWNENIALSDSPFYGFRVGFGFGPFFELRGTLEKSINIKNSLQGKDWNPFTDEQLSKISGMDIDVTRVGAESKINLMNGFVVAPYITLGGGVQTLDYNPFSSDISNFVNDIKAKESQIYLSAGLGMKFNINERMAFTLEGKNIRFNMDAKNSLLNPKVNDDSKKWGNWSAMASFDFYLGGSTANTDQRAIYTDGFKSAKFVIEPGVLFADFSEKTLRPDQWFMGGSLGVDFNSLIGLRAFYYQANKTPNTLDFNFNKDMKMYGVNLITRLNQPRGIVPYIQLGVGYLDDNNFINSVNGDNFKSHNLFALAGAGLEIPLSRYVAVFGTANAMMMSNKDVELNKLSKPADFVTNMAYTSGVRFNIGKPAYVKTTPSISEADNAIINDYKASEVGKASETESTTRSTLFGEQTRREKGGEFMTKQEFEDMVDRILQKIRAEEQLRASNFTQSEMDVILAALKVQNSNGATNVQSSNDNLLIEMRRMVDKLDRIERKSGQNVAPVHAQPGYPQNIAPTTTVAPVQRVDQAALAQGNYFTARTNFLKLNRLGALTGVNFGEGTHWMFGMRGFMQISNSALDFMPEIMIGFGKNTAFALSGNVVYNFNLHNSPFVPYAGLGLGGFNHGAGVKFTTNAILGTSIHTKYGEFFADYSIRGLFKNNQIAAGYRFVF